MSPHAFETARIPISAQQRALGKYNAKAAAPPRAAGGLVSNFPHPCVTKTKQHTSAVSKRSNALSSKTTHLPFINSSAAVCEQDEDE